MTLNGSPFSNRRCFGFCTLALVTVGCGGSDAGTGGTGSSGTTTTAATTVGSTSTTGATTTGTGGGGPFAINPAGGDVLTCSTVKFTSVGPKAGSWSVNPMTGAGTISGTGAVATYSAPIQVPVGPNSTPTMATVTYTPPMDKPESSNPLTIATAFPGTSTALALSGDQNAPTTAPFERRFSANGMDVYAAFIAADGTDTDVFHSADGGTTFTGPVLVQHMPGVSSATIVPDAATSTTAYLAYYSQHEDTGDNGDTVRVAVSTDSGATFPHEYVAFDTGSPGHNPGVRPDVVSTSAGHIVVAEMQTRDTGSWVETFAASGGPTLNLGVEGTPGHYVNEPSGAPYNSLTDTNMAALIPCNIEGAADGYGPRIFTNGMGSVCITYLVDSANLPGPNCAAMAGVYVQCSTNDGATWTVPKQWAEPVNTTSTAKNYVTGSMSPSGKIAVTWVDATSGTDEVIVGFSTAAAPEIVKIKPYPKQSRIDAEGGSMVSTTDQPTVAWQGDQILWITQTISQPNVILLVDKTCDGGEHWSGWVNGGGDVGSSFFLSSAGVFTSGFAGGTSNPAAIPLTLGTL